MRPEDVWPSFGLVGKETPREPNRDDDGFEGDSLARSEAQASERRYAQGADRLRFYDNLLERLGALPGVTHVALTSNLPGLGSGQREIEIEGKPLADGYTDDPLYWQQVQWLATVKQLDSRAKLYTFVAGPGEHAITFVGSAGAVLNPPSGAKFLEQAILQ